MTNLPTNPTKNDLIEKYWFEFLQFLVDAHHDEATYMSNMIEAHDHEYAFWNWLIERKLGPKDAS